MGIFLSIEEHNLNLQEVHWEQRFISLVNCPAALGGVGGGAGGSSQGVWQSKGECPPRCLVLRLGGHFPCGSQRAAGPEACVN